MPDSKNPNIFNDIKHCKILKQIDKEIKTPKHNRVDG